MPSLGILQDEESTLGILQDDSNELSDGIFLDSPHELTSEPVLDNSNEHTLPVSLLIHLMVVLQRKCLTNPVFVDTYLKNRIINFLILS
jgi:hypothetical protein